MEGAGPRYGTLNGKRVVSYDNGKTTPASSRQPERILRMVPVRPDGFRMGVIRERSSDV